VEQLVSAKVWEAESKKQPGPGETRATITVRQGSESEQVALWTREIGDNLPFAFSQEAFLTLVQEVSNGVVLESGS
jgi:hypothetical protein